jgi:Flp pilus assembly pilin Flp
MRCARGKDFAKRCNACARNSDHAGNGSSSGGDPSTEESTMNRIAIRIMMLVNTVKDEDRGGVAAEYGVLLAGIVAVVAVAAAALGGRIGGLFDTSLK